MFIIIIGHINYNFPFIKVFNKKIINDLCKHYSNIERVEMIIISSTMKCDQLLFSFLWNMINACSRETIVCITIFVSNIRTNLTIKFTFSIILHPFSKQRVVHIRPLKSIRVPLSFKSIFLFGVKYKWT